MELEKVNKIYERIANKINQIIPDSWLKVWLNAEVLSDSGEVYFYFYSTTKNTIIYSHDIPSTYQVSGDIYDDLLFEIIDLIIQLNDNYKDLEGNSWTNMTLLLDNLGEFTINYDYSQYPSTKFSPMEKQIIWEYEILGTAPDNDLKKTVIKKYLENE